MYFLISHTFTLAAELNLSLSLSADMAGSLKRVLLYGVSIVSLSGLLGFAYWLWGGKRKKRQLEGSTLRHSPLPAAAGPCTHTTNSPISGDTERKRLRPNAEEFHPTAEKRPSANGGAIFTQDVPLTLPPHPPLLKDNATSAEVKLSDIPHQPAVHESVKLQLRALDVALPTTSVPTLQPSVSDVQGTADSVCHSMELLGLEEGEDGGVPRNSSQGTSSSGFSDLPPKTDDSGILAGRKYPLTSSDVHSESFSEVESFGSTEEVLPQQQPLQDESDTSHSLHSEKNSATSVTTTDLIGKPAVKLASSSLPASRPAPPLSVSRLHPNPSPQLSMNMSGSRDGESPLLRLDSFKNRIKVTIQLPRDSVGRFIGKQGRNIKSLMSESSTHVYVNQKNLPKEAVSVPCHIQGSASEVEVALKQISIKFPEIDIPSSIDDISTVNTTPLGSLSPLFANIEEGVNWDIQLSPTSLPDASPFYAMVSYIERLNRLWLFPYSSSRKLDDLHQSMSFFYSYASSMGLPRVKDGDGGMVGRFCAAKVSDIHWLRGHVTKLGNNGANYELQLVDYGSNVVLPPASIKPLK